MRFRQDLRIDDNTALFHAVEESMWLIPVFVFDTTILKNFSLWLERIGFLIDAVKSLEKKLQSIWWNLFIFYGDPQKIIPILIKKHDVDALYYNKSYGVGGPTRDVAIKKYCFDCAIHVHSYLDYLMVEPNEIPSRKVYTPFYRQRKAKLDTCNLVHRQVNRVRIVPISDDGRKRIMKKLVYKQNVLRDTTDPENHLLKYPSADYEEKRNMPWLNATTRLSPYIRFWLLSVRKVYQHFSSQKNLGADTIIKELARREFWYHIMHYYPETAQISFQAKRRYIQRENKESLFASWKEWCTGYPIVDAAMRQLQTENRMHGRARMIVASFLTKDLLIDRVRWERHFADYLLDYDRAVNIGNRQWSASVWADPKPLRIFNPMIQSQRFDPQAVYIKRYLPELASQPIAAIHDPLTYKLSYHDPVINHYTNSARAKTLYAESAKLLSKWSQKQ